VRAPLTMAMSPGLSMVIENKLVYAVCHGFGQWSVPAKAFNRRVRRVSAEDAEKIRPDPSTFPKSEHKKAFLCDLRVASTISAVKIFLRCLVSSHLT